MRRAYSTSTRVLSGIIMLLGVTMVISALARGGGAIALGVVLGTMLALLGAGRLWLARGGVR
jgi:multisubunit Na+/H+ antiporter MnhB subunit